MRGIARVSGVEMFIVVALNVLLDSLLGCTSGGVLVRGKRKVGNGEEIQGLKMMHFRTLDWGMDGLRNLLVTLEFVRSKSREPERVIARSIPYAGFVGVLTGVRQDLSVSLNFRPVHYCSTVSLRAHQLLVPLGFRPSIASHLRSALFPPNKNTPIPDLFQSVKTLQAIKSSPCYLILCSGTKTTVIERDLSTSKLRTSTQFIVHTNHDQEIPSFVPQTIKHSPVGLNFWIEDSEYRAECVATKWAAVKTKHENKQKYEPALKDVRPSIVMDTLISWVKTYPVMNETSHFGCVMDPSTGGIVMLERDGFKKHRPNGVLSMN
ncbi:hypothetical protein HYALB_00006219 [Hymenoscyphus albidus]|uniref:ceramidase n=1 Tax=Hymenoscyphus albidus TaxID=595503 RepID=A0A9N9M2F3_9HELO|nr:hypothetical protein HYALB_00006219 [Hymenoscyphus albidus]